MTPRLPQPDFLRPTRRAGVLAWAWCATGALVLAAAGLEAAEAWQLRQQSLQRLALAERPQPGPDTSQAPQPSARSPAGWQAPADAAARAPDAQATRWLQRLALPWPEVFAAAEAVAVDGTQFTGLAFDGQGQLRLEGQAAQDPAALAAADALRRAAPGASPWQDVTLARLDRATDGRRFEIVARLAAPAAR